MSRRSILILTAAQLSRNPRVYKEAQALAAAGYDVTVVRLANVPQYEAYDRDLLRDAGFRCVVINHLGGTRAERGSAWRDRALTALARRACGAGVSLPHAFGPHLALLRAARQHPADLTIVHTEGPLCIGARLLREGRNVAADFEDWHSEDLLPRAQSSRPRALLREVERYLLREGAYCTTTSTALARALAEFAASRVPAVVRNSFPLQRLPERNQTGQPVRLFWFSQTVGPGRGLEPFLSAWGGIPDPAPITLLGTCATGFQSELLGLVPESARGRITFHPPVHPARLPDVIADHDIGLALEHPQPPSRDLTITNKIFQYANAGLAILATPTTGQREFLRDAPGAGLTIDLHSANTLGEQVRALCAEPERVAAMGRAARSATEALFCWEREQRQLLGAVAGAFSARESGGVHRADR